MSGDATPNLKERREASESGTLNSSRTRTQFNPQLKKGSMNASKGAITGLKVDGEEVIEV